MEQLTVRELVPAGSPAAVPDDGTVADVRDATRRTGHLRILLADRGSTDAEPRISDVVHVRDTLTSADDAPAAEHARPGFTLDAATTVHEALTQMRETHTHLAVLTDGDHVVGVVTLADVLRRLFPHPVGAGKGDRATSDLTQAGEKIEDVVTN